MKLICYLRVSTKGQGASGLGLDAQRAAVETFARAGNREIAGTFVEIESGRKSDRPELVKAIATARRAKATLCFAKLDRLSRNVAFLSSLMESGCDFVAVDNPNANRLTLHILAAVAEDEARRISERTTVALAAAKARGTLLGSARKGHWTGRESARLAGAKLGAQRSAEVRHEKSVAATADLLPTIRERRTAGDSLRDIAATLNAEGQRTVRGRDFTAMAVKLILDRATN
jgi:DNA invertase Pin-like site-specific DNA recombinase